MIALLGRRDVPVDGVEDYCTFLGHALAHHGVELERVRVNWDALGWVRALRELSGSARAWRNQWVILQFTALAWSNHAVAFGVLFALRVLRRRGTRVAVVFHEPCRQTADPSGINQIRGAVQDWIVRKLYEKADRAIFADPLDAIPWLPAQHAKAVFIPIGANVPESLSSANAIANTNSSTKTIAVFCLSNSSNRGNELADVSYAIRSVASQGMKVRVVFLGRGTTEAGDDIARAFAGITAEVLNLGLVPAAEVSRTLAASHVMLCVRGQLFPRRGSAIAGIACGLPIIAYAGASEGGPILEAGIELAPYRDTDALASVLSRVLTDNDLWQQLHERSVQAHRNYFSWDVIAKALVNALGATPDNA